MLHPLFSRVAKNAMEEARGAAHLDEILKDQGPAVLHFRAPWCEASKDMDSVLQQLARPGIRLVQVEAEENPEISEKYSVAAVPYFVFLKNGTVADTLEGANPAELAKKMDKLTLGEPAGKQEGPEEIGSEKSRIEKLINSHPVMLFMKGTPQEPKCGFSRKVVTILKEQYIPFGSFDVLSDEEIREGIKSFSNWPTFPQLYVNGELVGGCDIVSELHSSGELLELLEDKGVEPDMDLRLKKLIESSPTMLFMKGTPDQPKCGFSRKVVEALREEGIQFGSFDILRDPTVRQDLKVLSNWPTYPQLYHKGEFLGGCDIVMEMKKSGELKQALAT